MDIPRMRRSMRPDSAATTQPGAHLAAAAPGITIAVTQQCQVTLPFSSLAADEVTVTVTSHRPGVAAQVSIGANLNSPDFSYQGPTTTVGTGQFTATSSQVHAAFVVLPAAGWPILGVGAEATWADGATHSLDLTYVELACDPLVWWRWVIRVLAMLTSPFSARTRTVR